jgi:hypothetical protein
MNKKILFLTLIMVFLLPCVFSCSKRDKLTANKMLVSIEPKTVSVSNGDSITLSAFVRNAKFEAVTPENASWSVEPSSLGSFDNPNSVTTVFSATATGSGKVFLTCEGIQTSADITVS